MWTSQELGFASQEHAATQEQARLKEQIEISDTKLKDVEQQMQQLREQLNQVESRFIVFFILNFS